MDVVIGFLCGAEAGGVGDGAGEDADHRFYGGACNIMYGQGEGDAQEDDGGGQEVEGDAAALEGGEEAGTDLHADGVDEEDEPELFEEVHDDGVDGEAEVAHEDADEEDEGDAE